MKRVFSRRGQYTMVYCRVGQYPPYARERRGYREFVHSVSTRQLAIQWTSLYIKSHWSRTKERLQIRGTKTPLWAFQRGKLMSADTHSHTVSVLSPSLSCTIANQQAFLRGSSLWKHCCEEKAELHTPNARDPTGTTRHSGVIFPACLTFRQPT